MTDARRQSISSQFSQLKGHGRKSSVDAPTSLAVEPPSARGLRTGEFTFSPSFLSFRPEHSD